MRCGSLFLVLFGLSLWGTPCVAHAQITVDADELTALGILHAEGLQAALDQGGHVTIRGTFDIGYESLGITVDTVLEGESVHGRMAKIVGGVPALFVGSNADLSVINPDVEATVENIEFADATYTAIAGVAHKRLVVEGNVITRVFPVGARYFAVGILPGWLFSPGFISGTIVVTDNQIDLNPGGEISPHRGYGIFPAVAENVDLTIKDNVVLNFGGRGIEVLDCAGSLLIEDNLFQGSSVGAYFPAIAETGISVFNGWYVPDGTLETVVRNNEIARFGPWGAGIVVGYGLGATSDPADRPSPEIEDNHIVTDNRAQTIFLTTAQNEVVDVGIALRGLSSVVLKDNEISGYANIGIGIQTPDLNGDDRGDGGTLLISEDNDLTGLDVSGCVEAPWVPGTDLENPGTPPVQCGLVVNDLPLR